MITDSRFSDKCSVIAFYGISPNTKAINTFYKQAVGCFENLGYTIDKVAIEGKGFSGNYTTFNRTHSKLQKIGFGSITSFSLASLMPAGKDPLFHFLIDIACRTDDKLVAYIAVNSSILNVPSAPIYDIAKSTIQSLSPIYGIGYERSLKDGPTLYVVGIGQGGELTGAAYEEAVRHGHWGRLGLNRQVYREGIMRDVYLWNFLTIPHLESKVNNTSLQNWIQQDQQRGHLELINDGTWLWEVSETNILTVRSTLWDAGIIFNWRNYLKA